MRARRPRRSPAPRACRQARFSGPFPVRRRCCSSLTSGCSAGSSRWPSSTARHVLYAVETAIQLHIAELTEPLRKLYVTAYTLPSTSAYLYRSTAKRLEGIFGDVSSGRGGQGLLRDGDRLGGHDALVHGCAVRRVLYRGAQDRALFGVRAQALQCAARAAAGVSAAVLQLDLHAMAAGIIQTTVQQAEKGFEAVKAEPAF